MRKEVELILEAGNYYLTVFTYSDDHKEFSQRAAGRSRTVGKSLVKVSG
jgi:hypothetical protein